MTGQSHGFKVNDTNGTEWLHFTYKIDISTFLPRSGFRTKFILGIFNIFYLKGISHVMFSFCFFTNQCTPWPWKPCRNHFEVLWKFVIYSDLKFNHWSQQLAINYSPVPWKFWKSRKRCNRRCQWHWQQCTARNNTTTNNLSPVLFAPEINKKLSLQILIQLRNGILRGPEDTDSWIKPEVKNLMSDSL